MSSPTETLEESSLKIEIETLKTTIKLLQEQLKKATTAAYVECRDNSANYKCHNNEIIEMLECNYGLNLDDLKTEMSERDI